MTFPQLEDPFVLRKALDVSRKQLWELQDRINQLGPDGGVSRWVVVGCTLSQSCLKGHGGVPIALCIFLDPLVLRINCLVIRE